jgi:maleylpyruvate isomerase
MSLRLYGYWRSSCTWRVRIALAHKGLDYETVPVNLLEGEQRAEGYTQRNPMRQVPTLEVEQQGTTRRLTQSMAILEWLEETWPEPALLPEDPFERARARQLAEMVNAGIQPLQNFSGLLRLEELGVDRKKWGHEWIARGMAALEREMAETAGQFAVGDRVTFADLCLIPQLFNARRFEVEVSVYPTLSRVEQACAELPAFQAAHADRQPDAPSST